MSYSFSYTPMPSGPRTLLNYITSFGVNASNTNDGSAIWNSGRASLTLTHYLSGNTYFSKESRVNIIQGDGSADGPDWAIFNFDVVAGDYAGTYTTHAYFGGESSGGASTVGGGQGGLGSSHYGIIWGFDSGWKKLFQIQLNGSADYANSFSGWWSAGNAVASGNGKYTDYDVASITYIGFSVQTDSATIPAKAFTVTATLIPTTNTVVLKYVLNATIALNVFTTNNTDSYTRTYVSNATGITSIPNSSSAVATIVQPGSTTISVTQNATANFTSASSTINIVIIGQNATYSSVNMTSVDLSETNLSSTIFADCNLTSANLFGAIVNTSTDFRTVNSFSLLRSGRISGFTTLFPANYKMI